MKSILAHALKSILIIFPVLLSTGKGLCETKDSVKWARVVWPPAIEKNTDNDDYHGYTVKLESDLQERLPQYTHTVEYSNWQRLQETIKTEHAVSTLLIKTPEREEFMYYSEPLYLFPNRMIVCRKADLKKFSKNHSVSLEKLLKDPSLKLGLLTGRAYGEISNKIISKYENANNVIKNPAAEGMEGLFRMLENKRIDYLIEYPKNMIYYLQTNPQLKDQLVSLSIIENDSQFEFTYFVAPKNEWGKKIVEEVNQIMKDYSRKESFFERHKVWAPEHLWKDYRAAWEKKFGKLIKNK